MDDIIRSLKENIFYRAKIFIEDIGSFSPFGAKVKDGVIIDSMAYKDFEDTIEGTELISMLKGSFTQELKSGSIRAAAIAYDVSIQLNDADGVMQKRDALCLIISTDGKEWHDEYFPYMLIDGQCIWK